MMLATKIRENCEHIAIRLSPIIWLTGLSSVAYQIAAAWMLFMNRERIRRPTLLQITILSYCVVYLLSIALAAIRGADLVRVLAATYNFSIWTLGAIVFSVARPKNHQSIRRSSRLILFALFIAGLVSFFVFSAYGSVKFNSVLGSFIDTSSLPENLAANTNLNITSADWSTMGLGSRLSIMAPYPTALGMLALMLLALSAPSDWSRSSTLRYLPYIFFCAVLSILCASRAAMGSVAVFSGALAIFHFVRRVRSNNFKIFVLASLMLCIMTGGILLGTNAMSAWQSINDARAESSSLRFEIYALSFNSALAEHPFLGFGVKERSSNYAVPLGSHSTLVGSMYKTGIIGFTLMSLLFISTVITAVRVGFKANSGYRTGLAAGCAAMIPLLFFEDIDAIPLVAYLFFLCIALMERGPASDFSQPSRPRVIS